jgi:hypothetical protein
MGVLNSGTDGLTQVVINEILYHALESPLEFIELYNSSSQPVPLAGWVVKDRQDDHRFVFPPATEIPPQGYLVLADDPELFRETYGDAPQVSGLRFDLSNGGDTVRLFDPAGVEIDRVAYDNRLPWPEVAAGLGSSLERINPNVPGPLAQSWAASVGKGTPGQRNSVYQDQVAPLIVSIQHSPVMPAPEEAITVLAHVVPVDSPIRAVVLHYNWNESVRSRAATMADDGQHGDGEAGDGVYGILIPGSSAGSILSFYVETIGENDLRRAVPMEEEKQPYLAVVESPLAGERVNVFRVVMLPSVRQQFLDRYTTDEYFPASFYENDQIYYDVQIRHRGRSRVKNGRFKIRFPHNQLFRNEIRRLNFNGTDANWILREHLAYQLFWDAGLPSLQSEIVRLHLNGGPAAGTPYRVCIENPDGQFLNRRLFFDDDDGNLYKTNLDGTPDNKATWRYVGDDPELYRGCYIKQTNEEEDDFSDIIEFCRVLTQSRPTDPDYMDQVYSVLNPENFTRWMAVAACVAHWDSPFTDHGHNYVLYHNLSNQQFYILPWDLNGTFRYGTNPSDLTFRKEYTHFRGSKFDAVNQILNHPYFGTLYYREIDRLLDTVFTEEAMAKRIEEARLALQTNTSTVSFLKSYVTMRRRDLAEWIERDKGVSFLSKPVYQASVGELYSYMPVVANYRNKGRLAYQLKTAPAWLTIDPLSGRLQGVPHREGEDLVVIEGVAKDGTGIQQTFTVQTVNTAPRLLLHFNESGTAVNDLSLFTHPVQLFGSAAKQAGRLGQGVYLDGSRGNIRIPHADSLNLTGAVTVEAWIKPNTISTGNPVIVTKGDANQFNYTLMLGYGPFSWDRMEPCFMPAPFDGLNRVYYGRKEIEANLRANQWVHVAGTYDSAEEIVSVYVNNRRIVMSANRSRMQPNRLDLQIGLASSQGFRGVVDDLKILPFAKTQFAAGLCLAQFDLSGISPAQDRVGLSLSPFRRDAVDLSVYCLYRPAVGEWLRFPAYSLQPGKSVLWWLDELGSTSAFQPNEIVALYAIEAFAQPDRKQIVDVVVWGAEGPAETDPAVQAGLWLPGKTVPLGEAVPQTMVLKALADNDEMHLDWAVQPPVSPGLTIESFQINGGEVVTTNSQVRVSLQIQGEAAWMRVNDSPVFAEDWIPFQSSVVWNLSPVPGIHVLYVQVRDAAGNRSPVAQSQIVYEPKVPVNEWRTMN